MIPKDMYPIVTIILARNNLTDFAISSILNCMINILKKFVLQRYSIVDSYFMSLFVTTYSKLTIFLSQEQDDLKN